MQTSQTDQDRIAEAVRAAANLIAVLVDRLPETDRSRGLAAVAAIRHIADSLPESVATK
jgi:hypothetical protein